MLGIPKSARSHRVGRTAPLRLGVALGTAAAGTLGLALLTAAPASAGTCAAVTDGQTSGWCALYPGNATGNIQELGQVALSTDGSTLTVQTQSASTGVVPGTSFACLTATDPGMTRLQEQQCAMDNGVWVPFTGGSTTIDLAQYPQFQGTQFNVQVAANQDANSANGDAFYDNFTVTDTGGSVSLF
ncbi:MAG: hypothetical protein M0Z63_03825 [Actinomycetota bacterium]|jgi:hypothetical protein|nr:hypothetical protein [Actinomycetota bacterium]MDA8279541.1 hypothetical protein [Actinomycetota bacterium]